MGRLDSYLTSPIVITYRNTERSRTKKVKILRGKTDENITKLMELQIQGITENTVFEHIGIGYRYIPKDKLTSRDKRAIKQVMSENNNITSK